MMMLVLFPMFANCSTTPAGNVLEAACLWLLLAFLERFVKKKHGIASQNGVSGNLPFIVLHIFILRKKDFLLIEKRFLWDSIYTGLRSNSRC